MKNILFLVVCLFLGCGIQELAAQDFRKKEEGVIVYGEYHKFDSLKNLKYFTGTPPDSLTRKLNNTLGNKIIPQNVRKLLQQELEKPSDERGLFMIAFQFDYDGNILAAEITVVTESMVEDNLVQHLKTEDLECIYRKLLEEKVDMSLFRNQDGYFCFPTGIGQWMFHYSDVDWRMDLWRSWKVDLKETNNE